MSLAAAETEAEIWGRAIEPENGNLSPAAARAFLELKLPEADVKRVNELSSKIQESNITEAETRELDSYLNVGRALELLKAKARRSLQQSPVR